jgi:hypothetical protein
MTEGSMNNVGALATERDRPRVDRDDDLALAARSDSDAFGLLYERLVRAMTCNARTATTDGGWGGRSFRRRWVVVGHDRSASWSSLHSSVVDRRTTTPTEIIWRRRSRRLAAG